MIERLLFALSIVLLIIAAFFIGWGAHKAIGAEPGLTGAEEALIETVEQQMGQPRFLMALLWEESKHATESGQHGDCGPFGIKPSTATAVIGYPVSCHELQSVTFSLPIAVIYLTSPQWCGRYPMIETRLLCYRIGHNKHKTLRAYRGIHWYNYPVNWGTRKIMQRVWAKSKDMGSKQLTVRN